jgi:hypothetical protein
LVHQLARYITLLESGQLAKSVIAPVLLWTPPVGHGGVTTQEMKFTQADFAAFARQEPGKRMPNGVVYELKLDERSGRLTVGRSEDCGIMLASESVSRTHLQLNATAAGWTALDLGSKNGTWVGATKLQPGAPVSLTDGVRLQLGDVELFFMLPQSFCAYVAQLHATH